MASCAGLLMVHCLHRWSISTSPRARGVEGSRGLAAADTMCRTLTQQGHSLLRIPDGGIQCISEEGKLCSKSRLFPPCCYAILQFNPPGLCLPNLKKLPTDFLCYGFWWLLTFLLTCPTITFLGWGEAKILNRKYSLGIYLSCINFILITTRMRSLIIIS